MKYWIAVALSSLSINIAWAIDPLNEQILATPLPKYAVVRMGDNTFAHGAFIRDIDFIDEKRIVTFGADDAKIWHVASGVLLARVPGGGTAAYQHGGSKWLAVTSRDEREQLKHRIEIWDVVAKTMRNAFSRQLAVSSSLSADGKLLAVSNHDWSIELVDAGIGESIARIPPLDSKNNYAGFPIVNLSGDGNVLVICDLSNPAKHTRRYRFLPINGQGDDDRERDIGAEISRLEFPGFCRMIFTANPDHVLLVGNNGEVVLHDFRKDAEVARVRHGSVSALGGAMDRTGQTMATTGADGCIRIWDIPRQQQILAIQSEERYPHGVAFSDDGKSLITGGGRGRVRFWDVGSGSELRVGDNRGNSGGIRSVAISPNGKTVATAGDLGTVTMWDSNMGKQINVLKDDEQGGNFDPMVGPNFLSFSPNGQLLAAGSNSRHNSINIWDVATRQRTAKISGHRWPITAATFSGNGKMLASASRDKSIRIWDAQFQPLMEFPQSDGGTRSLAFSPDGTLLAATGFGATVSVWNLVTGIQEAALQAESAPLCVMFSPQGTRLASSHRGNRIHLWQLDQEMPVISLVSNENDHFKRQKDGANCIAFSPDGNRLAATRSDGGITIWDTEHGIVEFALRGHDAATNALAWHRETGRLVSGSEDGTVLLWALPKRQ